MNKLPFLKAAGNAIVDESGKPVLLRGVGLGGWLNMENFITGYPSSEEAHREALLRALGPQKYSRFFDRLLSNFFTGDDADFIKSMDMNLVRIPINYRHLEDDMRPFVIKEEGFRFIDKAVSLCGERGMYTILDLHALPGYQNQGWHSDNPTHKALYWTHRHFQERTVNIWKSIAARYRGNPAVAGYNPINEPADPGESLIVRIYDELVREIRAVDPDHVIFLEGNRYSRDFHMFKEVLPNVVYTNHDYALPGLIDGGPYPGMSRGKYVDKQAVKDGFLQRSEFMLSRDIPIWVGEFGPVYVGDAEKDAMRLRLLEDQLSIYDEYRASWAIWTYKDIGLQGICHTRPDSPWNRFIRPLTEKKARLGADSWGSTDRGIRGIIEPIQALMDKEFPDYDPFPSGKSWQISRMVRGILFSEALLEDFTGLFRGVTEEQLDGFADSFLFRNCAVRKPLAAVLKAHARA